MRWRSRPALQSSEGAVATAAPCRGTGSAPPASGGVVEEASGRGVHDVRPSRFRGRGADRRDPLGCTARDSGVRSGRAVREPCESRGRVPVTGPGPGARVWSRPRHNERIAIRHV